VVVDNYIIVVSTLAPEGRAFIYEV